MATDPRLQQMMQSMSQDPRMQGVMNNVIADMTFISTELKPDAADPDTEVSFASIIRTLCAVPSLKELGDDAETTEQVLSALQEHEAIDEAAIDGLEGTARRNVVLLFWQLNRQRKSLTDAVTLDEKTQKQASEVLRSITKLLLQAQMMMPQQRWIQQTLAVARASALVANSLWSHTDDEALALQRDILKGDGLLYPDVELKASARPKEAPEVETEVPCQVFPGKHVSLKVVVNRKHAGPSEGVQQLNQQGVLEAYWLYIEGQKPKGTPNSLLAAQPLVVKDLAVPTVTAEVLFAAPPAIGKYQLLVHVVSTSIVGIDLNAEVEFEVVEDDVPDLA